MAKCTGVRCPMQYGYKVDECNHTDCPYRTEPVTNADKIRAMSDEELADIMSMYTATGACNDWGIPNEKCGGNCRECIIDWLKQPAEE